MKSFFALLLLILTVALTLPAQAIDIELGASYGHKTTTFDANNSYDSESTTASASFYFWEQIAIELSYTQASGVRQEKVTPTDPQRTTYEQSQIIGADVIYVFADRKAFFQPYVKGGFAHISRTQNVKIEGWDTFTLNPDNAIVPSYGAGFKLAFTDSFGLKVGYEAWQTPIGGGQETQDSSLRVGLTWML